MTVAPGSSWSTVSEVLEKLELVHKEEDLKKMLRVE
jgi:hypothetical protein